MGLISMGKYWPMGENEGSTCGFQAYLISRHCPMLGYGNLVRQGSNAGAVELAAHPQGLHGGRKKPLPRCKRGAMSSSLLFPSPAPSLAGRECGLDIWAADPAETHGCNVAVFQ